MPRKKKAEPQIKTDDTVDEPTTTEVSPTDADKEAEDQTPTTDDESSTNTDETPPIIIKKEQPKSLFVDITREHIESDHSIRIRRDAKEFVEVEVWNNEDGIFIGAKTVENILTENGASFREDPKSKTIARIHFSPQNGEISHIEQVNN